MTRRLAGLLVVAWVAPVMAAPAGTAVDAAERCYVAAHVQCQAAGAARPDASRGGLLLGQHCFPAATRRCRDGDR